MGGQVTERSRAGFTGPLAEGRPELTEAVGTELELGAPPESTGLWGKAKGGFRKFLVNRHFLRGLLFSPTETFRLVNPAKVLQLRTLSPAVPFEG